MKWLLLSLGILAPLFVHAATTEEAIGRYQAVKVSEDTNHTKALILDTATGHFWLWHEGGGGSELVYQGKVTPGKQPGETIIRADRYSIDKPK